MAFIAIIDVLESELFTILYLIHLVVNSHIDPIRRNVKIVRDNFTVFYFFLCRFYTKITIMATIKTKIETLIELRVIIQS